MAKTIKIKEEPKMKTQNSIRKTSIGILFLLLALSAALIRIAQPHAAGSS